MPITHSVGVDFGTTTSLVSEGRAGRQPRVFPIGETTTYLPSLVGIDPAGHMLVGDATSPLASDRVKRSIKRCITLNEHSITLPDGTDLDADEAITAVLADIALKAKMGGVDLVPEATRLGCPAMWTGEQRMRLLDLAEQAGLPVTDHTLIDEPVAAGVAWVNQQVLRTGGSRTISGKLLVFDMGGGTLDVALLDVLAAPGEVPEISVLSSWGHDEAGDALDTAIADELAFELGGLGVDVEGLSRRGSLLMEAAREAKLRLTTSHETPVAVRAPGMSIPVVSYSREQLDVSFDAQLRRAENLVWAVLRGAQVTYEAVRSPKEIREIPTSDLAKEVDFVLLVGGMSRIPAITRMIERILPGVDLHLDQANADQTVVAGLGETIAYERINLHRPPLDFVLTYDDGGKSRRLPVYDAYSPFYPPYFAMMRDILYYEWRPAPHEVPRAGKARLCIYTPGGDPVALRLEGSHDGVIELPFGHVPPMVRIYPNGRVVVVDGRRRSTEFLVERWPVMRGKDHAVLLAKRSPDTNAPLISRTWENDPLFLH